MAQIMGRLRNVHIFCICLAFSAYFAYFVHILCIFCIFCIFCAYFVQKIYAQTVTSGNIGFERATTGIQLCDVTNQATTSHYFSYICMYFVYFLHILHIYCILCIFFAYFLHIFCIFAYFFSIYFAYVLYIPLSNNNTRSLLSFASLHGRSCSFLQLRSVRCAECENPYKYAQYAQYAQDVAYSVLLFMQDDSCLRTIQCMPENCCWQRARTERLEV